MKTKGRVWLIGILLILVGVGHMVYGTFCIIMNHTPEDAYQGFYTLDNGNEDRWLGALAVICGALMLWFGLWIRSRPAPRSASG